jgi:hypothetical protein
MPKRSAEHTLEFLLAFNGHLHHYAGGFLAEVRNHSGGSERGEAAWIALRVYPARTGQPKADRL